MPLTWRRRATVHLARPSWRPLKKRQRGSSTLSCSSVAGATTQQTRLRTNCWMLSTRRSSTWRRVNAAGCTRRDCTARWASCGVNSLHCSTAAAVVQCGNGCQRCCAPFCGRHCASCSKQKGMAPNAARQCCSVCLAAGLSASSDLMAAQRPRSCPTRSSTITSTPRLPCSPPCRPFSRRSAAARSTHSRMNSAMLCCVGLKPSLPFATCVPTRACSPPCWMRHGSACSSCCRWCSEQAASKSFCFCRWAMWLPSYSS
mmetsp:Transcript_10214/g.17112  ORF Transcript_10214/g.17112 Transcript_10214/m.17112 type:complete len:258 (+) Transcript_10214:2596-3369(+)